MGKVILLQLPHERSKILLFFTGNVYLAVENYASSFCKNNSWWSPYCPRMYVSEGVSIADGTLKLAAKGNLHLKSYCQFSRFLRHICHSIIE